LLCNFNAAVAFKFFAKNLLRDANVKNELSF